MGRFLQIKNVVNPDTSKILEYVDKRPSVIALVVDHTKTKGLFVKQYRAGSQSHILECPAGVIDEEFTDGCIHEVAKKAMLRELREEVGLEEEDIEEFRYISKNFASVGWTNEYSFLYIVVLKEHFELKEQILDAGEKLTYEWMDIDSFEGEFDDGRPIPIKTALLLQTFRYEELKLQKTEQKKMRLCIFGGSFNPVTNLHMSMAERIIDELDIDLFIFEPVGDKYEKDELISSRERHEMLELAIQDAENPKLQVGSYEMNQFIQPTTMATLSHYKEIYPDAEIFFMVGSDNLKKISGWANNENLLTNFQMVCIQREGDENIYQEIILNDIYLSRQHKRIHIIYENATNNISSTKVRNLIKSKKSITWLVPPSVKRYILEHGLYE